MKWERVSTVPAGFHCSEAVICADRLYLINPTDPAAATSPLLEYDLRTNAWQIHGELPNSPGRRGRGPLAGGGGGGARGIGRGDGRSRAMDDDEYGFGVRGGARGRDEFMDDDVEYGFRARGGVRGGGGGIDDEFEYGFRARGGGGEAGRVREEPSDVTPHRRSGRLVVALERLYLVDVQFRDGCGLWKYSPDQDVWEALAPTMPMPAPSGLDVIGQPVYARGRIYVARSDGLAIDEYDIKTNEWCPYENNHIQQPRNMVNVLFFAGTHY
jgi:hypothetical protein